MHAFLYWYFCVRNFAAILFSVSRAIIFYQSPHSQHINCMRKHVNTFIPQTNDKWGSLSVSVFVNLQNFFGNFSPHCSSLLRQQNWLKFCRTKESYYEVMSCQVQILRCLLLTTHWETRPTVFGRTPKDFYERPTHCENKPAGLQLSFLCYVSLISERVLRRFVAQMATTTPQIDDNITARDATVRNIRSVIVNLVELSEKWRLTNCQFVSLLVLVKRQRDFWPLLIQAIFLAFVFLILPVLSIEGWKR